MQGPAINTIGPTRTPEELSNAIQDIYRSLRLMAAQGVFTMDSAPASGIVVVAVNDEGEGQAYELVAGAGVTIVVDENARTITLTSP